MTVTQALTLSLSTTTIPFGTLAPGAVNSPALNGITATVVSNDPSGYSMSVAPVTSNESFGPGFPVSGQMSFSINGGSLLNAGVSETPVNNPGVSANGGDVWPMSFALSVPGNAGAGANLTAGFVITALGN